LYDFILYKFIIYFVEMSTTQNEKCKGKHFTWSKPMSHILLEILAKEALKGNKHFPPLEQNHLLRWLQKLVKSLMWNASLSMWTIISKLLKKNRE